MPATQPRLLFAAFFLSLVVASPAAAQLTVNVGSPPVTIVDGGAGDACAPVGTVCFAGSLVFAGYTVVGPCTAEEFVLPIGARLVLSECSVVKDAPAGPTVVPITFDSSVFSPLTSGDSAAVLDVLFTDTAPLGNLSVTLDAATNLGAIGTVGPLIPPPNAQTGFAGPTPAVGVNQLSGALSFSLDNVGDRILLPDSAQISALAPPEVPAHSRFGLLILGSLLLACVVVAIRRGGVFA